MIIERSVIGNFKPRKASNKKSKWNSRLMLEVLDSVAAGICMSLLAVAIPLLLTMILEIIK
jgi:hypothetical protein